MVKVRLYFLLLMVVGVFPVSTYCSGKELFNKVSQKYEFTIYNQKCLFYPAKKPQRLIVIFSYANEAYSMWSWFWKDDESWKDTSYLFLTDYNGSWYLGRDPKDGVEQSYLNIIEHFRVASGLHLKSVYTVGSSRGGYGALYYGIMLGVKGAIVYNPQVDIESSTKAPWYEHFVLTKPWFKELHTFIGDKLEFPIIFFNVSSYIKDFLAAEKFINVLMKKNCYFMYRKIDKDFHGGADMFGVTKEEVTRQILFMETLS